MRTLIAMPCLNIIQTPFFASFCNLRLQGGTQFAITESTLVYEARNQLCKRAIEQGFDRIFFLDSDMTFQPDLMERLSEDMDKGYDLVTALAFTRKDPIKPVIYKKVYYAPVHGSNAVIPTAESYEDYPKDSLFPIEACGFGALMVTTQLAKEVAELEGLPFAPMLGFGEDLSFCYRARKLGAKLYCDSRIKVGHLRLSEVNEGTWDARER